jgi:hypothetical protein
MRVLAAVLLMLAAPAHAMLAQPVAATTTLAPDAEARWVPFKLTAGNQIRFRMTLNGQPVIALLDTGVSFSVLARQYVEAQHLPVRAGGEAQAVGGMVAIGWADTSILTIGGLTRTGGGLSVAQLPALATGSVEAVDLLVGRDLIGHMALDIDFARDRFRLLPTGRMPFAGATAPLTISADHHVYVTRMTLGSRTLQPVIVDTGDGSMVTVTAAEWRAANVGTPSTTAIAFGLAGPIVTWVAVVPELRLGTLRARAVEVRVEPPGGFSDTIGVAGRIGTGFFQRYRVLLDPAAGHLVLSPGPDADKPPLRSTSGLLLGLSKDRLRVLHVMRGGPAEAAGWKRGETICRVDGQPIGPDYASSPLASWLIGAPGRTVSLGLCDGTVRALTLRSFY